MGSIMKKMVAGVLILCLCVSGTAAGERSRVSAATKVKLNKSKLTLSEGDSFRLKVTAPKKSQISYKSSRVKIAKVTKNGKVTAVKAGKAKVTVKVKVGKKTYRRTCTVIVAAPASQSVAPTTDNVPATAPAEATPGNQPTVSGTPGAAETQPTATAEPPIPTQWPQYAQKYATSYKGMTAGNPLLANSFACDPTALEYDGRVYVYMTNDSQEQPYAESNYPDEVGTNKYGHIRSVHVISSADMVNWTDHGIVYSESTNCCCWAPCITYKKVDGKDKFFLYYTNGGATIRMVSGDSPTGPFELKNSCDMINPWSNDDNKKSEADALDPSVFTDDDGTSYLVWGGDCSRSPENKIYPRVRQLSEDMTSFVGEEQVIEAPYFFEDSGINKIGDKYYFSYCSDWYPRSEEYSDLGLCSIAYMVADNPMGPYTYVGEVLPNCGEIEEFGNQAANNHHSFVQFQGEYYMFYHTMTLYTAMGIKFGGRSAHVNKLTINEDGTLGAVQQDLAGVSQLSSFDPYQLTSGTVSSNNGGMQAIHHSVKTKVNKKTGLELVDEVIPEMGARMEAVLSPEDYLYSWLSIKGADFGDSSASSFKADLKGNPGERVVLKVCVDSLDGEAVVDTEVTFDEQGEACVEVPVAAVTGKHDLFFEFDGAVSDFVSWQFVK